MDQKGESTELSNCPETCSRVEVPSREEVTALDNMRKIKIRVRELKKILSETSSSNRAKGHGRIPALEKEMARLKEEWNEWERKREDAAHQRMILLGHEEE